MTDPKATLLKLNQNLNILHEREAKYAGNAPLELLNQINDHKQAIDLTRQVITGELNEAEWREALEPLLVSLEKAQVIINQQGQHVGGQVNVAGDVTGDAIGQQIITHIYEAPPPPLPPAEAKERHDLGILLNKVKTFWIEGVLEKSIHNIALIDLGKETQAEAVAHAWEQVLELPDQSRETLPPNKKISHIFDELNRALLLLGEPGSGKTITLLQLARELITQAEADEYFVQPVPVIFNLSTWTKGQSLVVWLVAELSTKYQIPKRIGRLWLENNRLLPLLDGLDEVKPDHRAACVEAINAFGSEFGLSGLVVCSRLQEYTSLPVRLRLNGAIRLLPLKLEQIYDYLDGAGSKLGTLRKALQSDDILRTLAQSPLLLGIMTLAYQNADDLLRDQLLDTIDGRRKHLFNTFIERMFSRKGNRLREIYPSIQTKYWLSWVAQNMVQHNQSIFLLEKMQPSWLKTKEQRRSYAIFTGIIGGLLIGLVFVLAGGLSGILLTESLRNSVQIGVVVGLSAALWVCVGTILIIEFLGGRTDIALSGTVHWSWCKAFQGEFIRQLVELTLEQTNITSVEVLHWSWTKARKGFMNGLIFSLIIGLFVAFILALASGLTIGIARGVNTGLTTILSAGLLGSLVVGPTLAVFRGLDTEEIETRIAPNQGIWQSAQNAIKIGCIGSFVGSLAIISSFSLLFGLPFGSSNTFLWRIIILGSCGGLVGFLVFGLGRGGEAFLKHFILRFVCYRQGHLPWQLPHFLDYVTELVFLQKVGGGYIFIHRLLMEHFAAMNELKVEDG